MTMIMPRRSPKLRTSLLAFAGPVALFVAAASIFIFHGSVFRIASATVSYFSSSPSDEYLTLPKRVLASRLADAEVELGRVRYQALLYAEVAEENTRLTELLELSQGEVVAIGRVIARPPRTHYDTLLISLQEGHGAREGDRVVFEGMLLGKIVETSPRGALVSLFSSATSVIDARLNVEPTGIVTLKGQGGGAFVFEVPSNILIEAGNILVSAQHDTDVLAIVTSVSADPDRTVKTVFARAPVSFSELRFVTIERLLEEGL